MLPFVGIAFKWLVVGKHTAGRYALWGGDYLRWWTGEQLLFICGPRREPFTFTPMGVNSISPAHLHVRPMWVLSTRR